MYFLSSIMDMSFTDLTAWVTHRVFYTKQEQLTFRESFVSSTGLLGFFGCFFYFVRSVLLMCLVLYDMCVFCFFIRLSSSLCAQCCLCLCIVYSRLLFGFLYRSLIMIIRRLEEYYADLTIVTCTLVLFIFFYRQQPDGDE